MISKDQKKNIICTIDECGETFYGRHTAQHPAAVIRNNNKKFRSFKSKENWFQEVTESSEDTVRECLEGSKEPKNKNNTEGEMQEHNKTSGNDTVESNDYDSDHYSEVDANGYVGNVDTLVDDADIDNKCDNVFIFAPGEGPHPLSLYQDKNAEYLCFPSIFCGQTPPSKDERLVPAHYSDIVKWELQSVDRRAAQSVPNIFFKHKNLQMKLEFMLMKHYAPNRCEPSIKALDLGGGSGQM